MYLDAHGSVTIDADDVDNGSNDACGITLSVSPNEFTCTDVGDRTVMLTVTDSNGNSDTATVTVTVKDTIAPTVLTQDITVYLDANGNATIDAGDVDNGSSDACGIEAMNLDKTDFDCADVGANTVTLKVADVNGNVNTATATVTVQENIDPVAVARGFNVR